MYAFLLLRLDSEEWKLAIDNKSWRLEADRDIMLWTTTYPQDWQVGGKCDAYFWGNGRHGQLSEGGNDTFEFFTNK